MKEKILGLLKISDTETKNFILERLKNINDYVYSVL